MKVKGITHKESRLRRKLKRLDAKLDRLELKAMRIWEKLGCRGHRKPVRREH